MTRILGHKYFVCGSRQLLRNYRKERNILSSFPEQVFGLSKLAGCFVKASKVSKLSPSTHWFHFSYCSCRSSVHPPAWRTCVYVCVCVFVPYIYTCVCVSLKSGERRQWCVCVAHSWRSPRRLLFSPLHQNKRITTLSAKDKLAMSSYLLPCQ